MNVKAVITTIGPIVQTLHREGQETERTEGWVENRKEEEEEGEEGTIKEWSESTESEVKRERGREGRAEEGGRQTEKMGDVTSNRQPMRVREVERESGQRRVCFSITAASAEKRGAQSIS